MNTLTVIGCDPGFASVGLAAVDLTQSSSKILAIDLIETKPSHKKLRLAVPDDDSRRLAEIEDRIMAFFCAHNPAVVAMEDPPWGKSAKAVKSCALMWGACHGISRQRGVYVINLGAQLIKRTITGSNSASKEEVLDALKKRHPDFKGWPDKLAFEHVADAVGAAITARSHPVVFALLGARGVSAKGS
jgi:Holliday junction resolvasome RuvABC endonuclease subunit